MLQRTSTKVAIAACTAILGAVGVYFDTKQRAEAMPPLPVTVSFHHALLAHSMVADFHSNAPTDMAVVVDVMDTATRNHRQFEIGVGPGRGGTHIGPLERVTFEPGERTDADARRL